MPASQAGRRRFESGRPLSVKSSKSRSWLSAASERIAAFSFGVHSALRRKPVTSEVMVCARYSRNPRERPHATNSANAASSVWIQTTLPSPRTRWNRIARIMIVASPSAASGVSQRRHATHRWKNHPEPAGDLRISNEETQRARHGQHPGRLTRYLVEGHQRMRVAYHHEEDGEQYLEHPQARCAVPCWTSS